MLALSFGVLSMNFGRLIANSSTKLSSNCCPAFCPLGSMTLSELFLPLRSTIKPFDKVTFNVGGTIEPSRSALLGLYLLPPNAQAILSRTLVLPWLLFPPITVKPLADGSILTALIRLTFSISNLLIVTIKILTSNSECINFYRFSLRDNFTVF